MIDLGRRDRRPLTARSQLATELLLTAFSLVGSVLLLRTVLVILKITDRVWIGEFVYGITRPVTDLLEFLPGARLVVFWNLTIIDLTLLGFVLLFLLGIVATGRD